MAGAAVLQAQRPFVLAVVGTVLPLTADLVLLVDVAVPQQAPGLVQPAELVAAVVQKVHWRRFETEAAGAPHAKAKPWQLMVATGEEEEEARRSHPHQDVVGAAVLR